MILYAFKNIGCMSKIYSNLEAKTTFLGIGASIPCIALFHYSTTGRSFGSTSRIWKISKNLKTKSVHFSTCRVDLASGVHYLLVSVCIPYAVPSNQNEIIFVNKFNQVQKFVNSLQIPVLLMCDFDIQKFAVNDSFAVELVTTF